MKVCVGVCVCMQLYMCVWGCKALSFTSTPNFIKSSELFTECLEYSIYCISAEAGAVPPKGRLHALPLLQMTLVPNQNHRAGGSFCERHFLTPTVMTFKPQAAFKFWN